MRLRIDKQKFILGFERSFGINLNARSEAGLGFILDKFNQEDRLKNIYQFAYVIATFFHESSWAPTKSYFVPIREGKARRGTPAWDKYQSKYWHTGFYGRGFVQTTHASNYRNAGILLGLGSEYFVQNPDEMLKPEFSYETAIISMIRGLYRENRKTSRRESLGVYLGDDTPDYVNARNIINGDVKKNGRKIADEAIKFERLLRSSMISQSAALVDEASTLSLDAVEPIIENLPDVSQTQTTIKTDNVELTSTTSQPSEATEVGLSAAGDVESSFSAMIPQIDTAKSYLKSLFSGGIVAAISAFWLGLPMWVQVSLVVFVIVVVVGGIALFIRYYKDVFGFVTAMNTLRATQGVGNPILTKPEQK